MDAVNEASLSGLPNHTADALIAGSNTDGYTARYVAQMVHHMRSGASHPGDYDASAAEAVRNAFSGVPNGPSNMGQPINNYHRWQGAARSYQSAIDGAAQAASAAGHHEVAALLQDLKVTPKAADKQALADSLLATHPEASAFLSPTLLKGIQ